jgi:hypothetical protein
MARILILDPDTRHAGELVRVLTSRSYRTTTCASIDAALSIVGESETPFDVIIVVLPADGPDDWGAVASMVNVGTTGGLRSMGLCVSRVYRGPHTRLEAERRGLRLAYERPI